MAQVRYNGSTKRISGLVGTLLETRHLSLESGEVALVRFPQLPSVIREWNLPISSLELVA
jgi:hypothetical protein